MLEIEVQGHKVPALGFGTWQLAGKEAREATRHALEIGYRQIDTAQMYGNEEEVGRGIAESGVPRVEVLLTT
jgi:2,5-diketo-D-gluconate reductase B